MDTQNNSVNQPVINSVPEPIQPPTKSNNFLLTLLSVLLLISVGFAGFFAYQTQQLVKQLTGLKSEGSPTPTTNNLQPTTSPNPTADWNTYINTDYDFEVKYPDGFKALIDKDNLYGWPNAVVLFYNGGQSYDLPIEIWNSELEYKQKYPEKNSNITVFKTQNNKYITLVNTNNEIEVTKIISTFKFIEPEASGSPVACTMEVKICPDGSSVGRVGPNCEFAPCPN